MSASTRRQIAGVYRPPVNSRPVPPPRPDAVAQLCRTANTVRAHLERTVLREAGMTWTSYDVLVLICARRVVEPRVIAVEVGIAKATLTNTLSVLVDRDLVRRQLHERDRRRVVVRPTQAGLDLARELQRLVHARQAELFAGPGMPPRDNIAHVLRVVATRSRPDDATQGREGAR
ncbi:MarR family winged helix-turn-helix transcriptional regulator [Micromonospora sp. NPDC049460]|uniref:MarR family winged helix-turn-helix transcriptional regulator n=1 Tax=Micromonospora sp. NPDC049460 TaxID=3364272 RepID=UPI0037A28CDA